MQTIEIKPFGVAIKRSVAASVEEYDQLAKKTGACLEAALDYHNYHVDFSDIREVVLHGQEEVKDVAGNVVHPAIKGMDEVYGVTRHLEPVLDDKGVAKKKGDGTPITSWSEKEKAFFERVVAEKGISVADQTAFIQSVADQLSWDPSVKEHAPRGPGKLAAVWVDLAKKYLAVFIASPEKLTDFNTRVGNMLAGKSFSMTTATGDTTVDTASTLKDVDTLGRLLKEFSDAAAKAAAAQAMAALPAVV